MLYKKLEIFLFTIFYLGAQTKTLQILFPGLYTLSYYIIWRHSELQLILLHKHLPSSNTTPPPPKRNTPPPPPPPPWSPQSSSTISLCDIICFFSQSVVVLSPMQSKLQIKPYRSPSVLFYDINFQSLDLKSFLNAMWRHHIEVFGVKARSDEMQNVFKMFFLGHFFIRLA